MIYSGSSDFNFKWNENENENETKRMIVELIMNFKLMTEWFGAVEIGKLFCKSTSKHSERRKLKTIYFFMHIYCVVLMRFNFHERQPEINTRWTLSKWNKNTVLQRIQFFDLNEAEAKNITTKWFIRIHFQLINDCDRREWQFNECDTEKYHHLCWKFELCKIINSKRLLPNQNKCRYSFWPSMMTIRA